MNLPRKHWIRLILLGVALLVLIVVGVAAGPAVVGWLNSSREKKTPADEEQTSAKLVDDSKERLAVTATALSLLPPSQGPAGLFTPAALLSARAYRPQLTLQVAPEVVEALHITTAPVRYVNESKPLPGQLGQLAYDIDRMYPVRSIANGRVIRIEPQARDVSLALDPTRPLGFGDEVEKGQLLAIVRSPDLADKKGAYVDALLDLHVDQVRFEGIERAYKRGAISEATYRDARAKVEKDVTAVARTRRALELVPLEPKEIDQLITEANKVIARLKDLAKDTSTVGKRLWDRDQVEKWARIEVRAPGSGVIVEKNTNVGDIADPGKDPPLFRIADLKTLGVWIHPPEEYLPVLQKLLAEQPQRRIPLTLKLLSDPTAPPIKGELLRFAPSIDPLMRTPLLIGRIANPEKNRLIGQLVTATIYVPENPDLVEIPTAALNEVHGQSLVFVQARGSSGGLPRYTLRRVQVVHRFADVVQVRSELNLTAREREKLRQEVRQGKLPLEPLKPGEWVVTGGVVELTDAVDNLKTETPAGTAR
jgi:cobalt-zinc-cadmium efflux system membrane fusion protein